MALERDASVFARNVRAFRVLTGWSMRDLSRHSGLALQTIVNVEAGRGCKPKTEELLAMTFGTQVGRLWNPELLCDSRQRLVDCSKGRWFFGTHEIAKEYARMHRHESCDAGPFRSDPDAIQDDAERHRLGHVFSWSFFRTLGSGILGHFFQFNIAEVFGRTTAYPTRRTSVMLVLAQFGNVRTGIRDEQFELREGNAFVYDWTDPWWVEPVHPVRAGEKPPIIQTIRLQTLALPKAHDPNGDSP